MELRKSREEGVNILTKISKAAFHTDSAIGGKENDGPLWYDSIKWHKKMLSEGHLYTYINDNNEIVGGAVLFVEERKLYVGRIFINPIFFRKGLGKKLMKDIEGKFENISQINLDTPVWNVRTNNFYVKCGYSEIRKDNESVYYEKRL